MYAEKKLKPGREAKEYRKARIMELIGKVKGNRGWRSAFVEAYPEFDTVEGARLMTTGLDGRTADPDLLAALEEWIPQVEQSQPDWFQKMD